MSHTKPSLKRMAVEAIMTKPVKTIEGSRLLEDCIRLMRESDIGSLVVTEKQIPIGIFTERDVLRRAAEGPENLLLPMKNVMSKPLITIQPTATVWDAVDVMSNNKIRHLPVDDGGKLVGILTQRDLFHIFFSNKELLLAGVSLEEMRRFMLG